MEVLFALLLGYLIGSIPVGLLVTRFQEGVDIRQFGSGKTGFTNSLRVLGLRRSLPVFLGDMAKGLVAVLLVFALTDDEWARGAAVVSVIAGHIWPVFAGFRGGRGLLTGAGALLALNPLVVLAVTPVAGLALLTTRYMSLASISAAAVAMGVFLALAAFGEQVWANAAAVVFGGGLVILAHHDNIGRLLSGTERKIGQPGQPR